MSKIIKQQIKASIIALIGLIVFLLIAIDFVPNIQLSESTHLFSHTLLELGSIIICSAIFIYGWFTWNYTKSRILLCLSVSFLSIAILDTLHTLSFNGMPFTIAKDIQVPTWFWIAAKFTEILAICLVVFLIKTSRFQSKHRKEKYILLTISLAYTLFITYIILAFNGRLPLLVIEGIGTTTIKNYFEYFYALFHFVGIIFLIQNYRRDKNDFYLSIILAFYFLMLCSLTFTLYVSVHDFIQITGHLFKIAGYYFILKAFYFTNIKELFQQKKLTEDQLHDTKQELNHVLLQHEGIIIKIVKIDNQFAFKICDGKLLNKLNLSPDEIIGHTPHHFLEKGKADFLHEKFMLTLVENKQVFEAPYRGYSLLINLTKVVNANGSIEIVGNIVDVTKMKQTEELLIKSEKLSIVGELAAGFAHEIRNPLTTLKGFLQLMNQSEKENTYTGIMLKEIDRLEMITSEFMLVAKPQATNFKTIPIKTVIENVNQFLTPQALLKNVQLSINSVTEEPLIFGDDHQLKQVFINLYKNAMEAMPAGGKIISELSIDEGYISISIIDEGCGIPSELIHRLGEPFYTLKEKGTGLGLMVSNKIIENHKGKLEISSTENVGTTVTVKLPILQ